MSETRQRHRFEDSPIAVLVGPDQFPRTFARAVGSFGLGGALVALVALALPIPNIPQFHPAMAALVLGVGVAFASVVILAAPNIPPEVVVGVVGLGTVGALVILHLNGPRVEVGVAALAAGAALSPLWVPPKWAAALIGMTAIGYAIVLASSPGYAAAPSR